MKKLMLSLLGLLLIGGSSVLLGQQTGYMQSNLVANLAGVAKNTDAQLTNPWGIAFLPGNPFWIANNNGGTSTLYDAEGNKQALVVGIPSASVNPCNPGCPTGMVANSSSAFNGGAFIFDTEDGIIANWTGANNAVVAFDNSANQAVYKGLALVSNASGSFLLAANFRTGNIDVLDRNFKLTALAGAFKDPNLPAGMAPHGVHIINNQVYVAYAAQDSARHDAAPGAGSGVVDVFDVNGNFVKRFASGGKLNAPWGVVATPAAWGTFSNAILVGNFGDGTISAFNSSTGSFLGQVTDSGNNVIVNPGLWDMVFGQGGTGDPNTLYFTAGGASQTTGLFATLVPTSAPVNADFSLSLSAQSATLSPGQSAMITINASAVGGFDSPISLSCANVSGVSCAFSPAAITPGSGASSSVLTVTAAASAPAGGYGVPGMWMGFSLSGLGLFGMVFATRKENAKPMAKKRVFWVSGLSILILFVLLSTVGCGSMSSNPTPRGNSTVTLMVTGTSGSLAHTTPVMLTIN